MPFWYVFFWDILDDTNCFLFTGFYTGFSTKQLYRVFIWGFWSKHFASKKFRGKFRCRKTYCRKIFLNIIRNFCVFRMRTSLVRCASKRTKVTASLVSRIKKRLRSAAHLQLAPFFAPARPERDIFYFTIDLYFSGFEGLMKVGANGNCGVHYFGND